MSKTVEGEIQASGIGGEKLAYWNLLSNLCRSGVVLTKIRLIGTGLLSTLIQYEVRGSDTEVDFFVRLVNGDAS